MSGRIARSLAVAVGAGALVMSFMAPASAAPTLRPADAAAVAAAVTVCNNTKDASMDVARTNFQGSRKAAIATMQAATGSHKDAATAKRTAMKAALGTRKAAFTAARTTHATCIAAANALA